MSRVILLQHSICSFEALLPINSEAYTYTAPVDICFLTKGSTPWSPWLVGLSILQQLNALSLTSSLQLLRALATPPFCPSWHYTQQQRGFLRQEASAGSEAKGVCEVHLMQVSAVCLALCCLVHVSSSSLCSIGLPAYSMIGFTLMIIIISLHHLHPGSTTDSSPIYCCIEAY